ncbi:hypothetical protein ACT453_29810, partial [Bacillus sp. D-CC]
IPAIAQMIFFLIFKNIHMEYILHFNYNLIIILFSYIATILNNLPLKIKEKVPLLQGTFSKGYNSLAKRPLVKYTA